MARSKCSGNTKSCYGARPSAQPLTAGQAEVFPTSQQQVGEALRTVEWPLPPTSTDSSWPCATHFLSLK